MAKMSGQTVLAKLSMAKLSYILGNRRMFILTVPYITHGFLPRCRHVGWKRRELNTSAWYMIRNYGGNSFFLKSILVFIANKQKGSHFFNG